MRNSWIRLSALAAAGALAAVTLPAGPAPAAANEWIELDLAEADRVNAVLDEGGLGVAEEVREPMAASLRGDGRAPTALAVFPTSLLTASVATVEISVEVGAGAGRVPDLVAEVRGLRSDGGWTEWREAEEPVAGAAVALPDAVEEVQVRVGLGPEAARDGGRVSAVRLRAAEPVGDDPETEALPEVTEGGAEPVSARLFATRVGLVGHQTANGHTIRVNDYFAALPSRRGLAPRGEGDYTVRVCNDTGTQRCVYLPVWDVGPWNIKDDHWNAGREMWIDLPRGKPQAQAAYLEGHNGGVDGFGREVRNPAGIDLGDGAFRYGLRLPSNAWVNVDYLWTGDQGIRAEVRTESRKDPVVLRSGPGTEFADVGRAGHSAHVDVECYSLGEELSGPAGETDLWYRLGAGDYAPAAFVEGGEDAPECVEGE